MAISGPYFLNAPSLGSATAVFNDSALSVCADNGFYSDGIIVREQIDCVLLPQETCPDCILPVTGLTWALTVNNDCDAAPWTISNQNLKIRYDITDSDNCGGTCDQIQAGTATATITVGAIDVNMGLSFEGIGELQAANFEKITFSLDGTQVASANAAGGNQGCQMGPVVQVFAQAPPYFLLANTVHVLFIDFTTNDELFHVGSFYEVDLTFVEVP